MPEKLPVRGRNVRLSTWMAGGLMAAAFTLSACVYRIDESAVFMPPDTRLANGAPLEIRNESELRDDFGATVAHSVERFGDHDIALTVASRDDPTRPLILSCSGNAADRTGAGTNYASKILPFGDAVLWDYPGYGDSSGEASVADLEAVSDDLLAWLDAKAGDRPVILWGHSLGGFVCADLARRDADDAAFVDAVVLETTARNVEEVARAWKPWWVPVRLRADEALKSYDTADALSGFQGSVVVLGAGRDQVLPVELHRSLARSLPQARYLEMAEATHYSAGFDPRAVDVIEQLVDLLIASSETRLAPMSRRASLN